MKFNRKIALYATAFLLGAAVTAACSNKKEQPASQSSQSQAQSESGSQVAQSSANAASSAANQAEKAVSLNYDIVNHVGDDKEAIINALGKPANENKTDISTILEYSNPDRKFHLFPETDMKAANTCWAAFATTGDLWGVKDKMKAEDFIKEINTDSTQQPIYGENLDESEVGVGKKGQKTVEFASDGYSFIIALNDDSTIDANSPAGVFTLDSEATPIDNAP